MCGVIGLIGPEQAALEIYNGLLLLQHRGQDSAGILSTDGENFFIHKQPGLVNQVFSKEKLEKLKGRQAIGQVRYPTIGSDPALDAQPFYVNYPLGIGMVHNGNIANYSSLKEHLKRKKRVLTSTCDVEVILNVFADELSETNSKEEVFKAVKKTMEKLNGSYSVISMILGKGMLAFRDPKGIRPLVMGEKQVNGKKCFAFSSETSALDFLGYHDIRDVKPGEAILITNDMRVYSERLFEEREKHCMFEWVYFARPDSVIENKSVYEVRLELGKMLGKRWKEKGVEADVIMPVPDSSRPAAIGFSEETGIPYREGLVKNRYAQRTFIMSSQEMRENAVKLKLAPVVREIKGKRIVLIDDSIVRGTTSKKIITMMRKAGAKEIHLMISCLAIKHPCYYGIDMSTEEELIAAKKTIEEIKEKIGADSLTYQSIPDLEKAIGKRVCTACLDGNYPTDVT